MNGKIEGQEYSISKVFSSDFEFIIPSYQRPYAWGKEQTEELIDDLYNFFKENEDEYYFLGSIVLIKKTKRSLFRGYRWTTKVNNFSYFIIGYIFIIGRF